MIHEKEKETKVTGTALFEDEKIKNLYFDNKFAREIEEELYSYGQ